MAVQRIWFPNAPSSGISAADRAQIGIGYGGITIALADWGASNPIAASWGQPSGKDADWAAITPISGSWA